MTFRFFCCLCCLYILHDRHLTLDLWAFNTFFSLTNSTTSMTETHNWCVLVLARLQLIHSEVIWLLGWIKTNDLTVELAQMFTIEFFFFLIQLSFLILWLSPQELYQQTNLWKAVLPWVNLQICLGLNIVETCWDGVSNTGLVILKTFKCPHLPICVIFILVSDLTSTPFLYQVPLTFSSDTSHLKTAWSFAFTVRSAMLW